MLQKYILKMTKNFVYTLIYSVVDGDNFEQRALILLFRKSRFSYCFADRYILKGYEECGFYVYDDKKLGRVNTKYLGQDIPVRSAHTWVFPGGSDDNKGPQFSYVKLKQQTGFDTIARSSANVFQPSGGNYSVTLIKVSESDLQTLNEEANKNFTACQEYRARLNKHSSIQSAKSFANEKLPPLIRNKLCYCKISTFNEAVAELSLQRSSDWFLAALDYLKSEHTKSRTIGAK